MLTQLVHGPHKGFRRYLAIPKSHESVWWEVRGSGFNVGGTLSPDCPHQAILSAYLCPALTPTLESDKNGFPPFAVHVTLGESIGFSVPPLPHLYNGYNTPPYQVRIKWGGTCKVLRLGTKSVTMSSLTFSQSAPLPLHPQTHRPKFYLF